MRVYSLTYQKIFDEKGKWNPVDEKAYKKRESDIGELSLFSLFLYDRKRDTEIVIYYDQQDLQCSITQHAHTTIYFSFVSRK